MKNLRISRRNLLKGTALAVPYVITSTALGNDDTLPASERVTLGHIGVGAASSSARACTAWPSPMPTRTAARPTRA